MLFYHPQLNIVKQPGRSVHMPVTNVQPIVKSTQYLETSDEKRGSPVKQTITSVNQPSIVIPRLMDLSESIFQAQLQQPLTEDQPLFTSVKQPVSSVKQPVSLVNQSLNAVQYPVASDNSAEHQQQQQILSTKYQPFSSPLPNYFTQSFYLPLYHMPHFYPTHQNLYWVPDMFPGVVTGSHQLDCINQDQYHVLSTRNGSLED